MKFEIKTDPALPHHYIIGVSVKPATSGNNAGKLYLKYGPLYFTNNDVEEVQHAVLLSNDKLFKTSHSEALAIVEKKSLVSFIWAMKVASGFNQCTLHHFSCEFETDTESFETIVKVANIDPYFRDLLKKSEIRG